MKIGDVVVPVRDDYRPETGEVAYRVVAVDPPKVKMVTFYFTFGWLTEEEFFELRQKEPRVAP